jgi:predicted ferric reductase
MLKCCSPAWLQEMYVANLRISPLQWHPFTFIPGKRPNTLRAMVKSYGRWTQSLMDRSGTCAIPFPVF